jgi:outer membrane lipoprotein-sorting protein
MKKLYALLALLLLVAIAALAYAMTADELIAKNVEAKGGLEKIKAIQSMKATGKYMMMGMELPMTIYNKRPNLFRMEISAQGMTVVQAYDGKTAWTINPLMGSSDPEKIPGIQGQLTAEHADIDGMLMNYKDKGYSVKLLGEEDMEGTKVYHLQLAINDSLTIDDYIDAEYFLELKMGVTMDVEGNPMTVDTYLGDYKAVDGVLMPFTMETKLGDQVRGEMVIDTIMANIEIPDSLFEMPVVKKKDTETKPEEE